MNWNLSFLPEGGRHGGKLAVDAPDTHKSLIEKVPGYAWATQERLCAVPKAWPAVLTLGELANRVHATLSPDAEVLAWYKKNSMEWRAMREAAAKLGEGEKTDGLSFYPHQLAGAKWLLLDNEMSGRALLDETGIGKTGTFIAAILEARFWEKGPILVVCPETVMTTGWTASFKMFAPELRTVEITGTAVQRRKKFDAVVDGQFDVVIIGYSNLRTSTRLEAFPGQALRRCVTCGGPRLTTGQVDSKGKPLPDIIYHDEIAIRRTGLFYTGYCRHPDCTFVSQPYQFPMTAAIAAGEHAQTFKKISEVTVANCQSHHKELNDIPWSVIIADEIHRAMNPKSQTSRALWGAGKYSPAEPRRWGATGTPISTDFDQIWPILHFLDPKAWPAKSKWVDWYCNADYNYAGFWEVLGLKPEREKEFHATFDGCSRRVLKEQVLNLPPKLRWGSLEERLTMTGEQLRVYNSMKEEMLALVEEGAITAATVLSLAGRLSLLASGTGYPISDTEVGLKRPSVKLDHLISMWQDGEWKGEQVAVLFASRKALRMAEQGLYDAGIIRPDTVSIIAGDVSQARRTEDINDFQSGKRKVVLLTYAAGGTGITLTAASTVIVFERNWSSILNAQGEDRFHRIGSERHNAIVYRDLVVGNSNEVAQLERLQQNAETLESIVHDKDKLRAIFGA